MSNNKTYTVKLTEEEKEVLHGVLMDAMQGVIDKGDTRVALLTLPSLITLNEKVTKAVRSYV
jgi:hypothetical protein